MNFWKCFFCIGDKNVNPKSLKSTLLIFLLISIFSLTSINHFCSAQDSTSYKISGYILDSNGIGIASAMIIFNVPTIVPSVYSDVSGYYEINAPAGTYHVNVWPPFDSNYIYYDEPALVVGSDIAKNITLNTGYKVSGYITDESGNPVKDAIVSVGTYYSGWFSNYVGYYFLSAPAGTYNLRVAPRSGYSHFTVYYEYDFVVDGNITKNFSVLTSSPSPSPSPLPTSEPSPTPTPSVTPTPSPTPGPTPIPTPSPSPKPARSWISISADASSSHVGSAVIVNGKLVSSSGSALVGETVILSFAVGNTYSWIPVGSDITNDFGNYNIQWINDASGVFTLKVEWSGDIGYQITENMTSLSFLPYNGANIFHIESNSTVSSLAFNSTSLELGFAVTGPDGTGGYVKTTIAKDLVSDPENIQIFLDGDELTYELNSNVDSWVLFFTYTHSLHQVSISLAESSEVIGFDYEYLVWIVLIVVIVVIGIGLVVYFKKFKH